MEISEILAKCDHTLLSPAATWEDIKALCDDGMKYKTASVCIPASFVQQAKFYVEGKLPICTVIGFPNGYATTAAKCFMAYDAISHGADEVDMVVNIGWVKEGKFDAVTEEIRQRNREKDIDEFCNQDKIAKEVENEVIQDLMSINFIIEKKHIFYMSFPLLAIDLITRIYGYNIDFYEITGISPNLFTLSWIILFIGISLSFKSILIIRPLHKHVIKRIIFFIFVKN